jgi:four helix bundle protein
MSSFKDLKLYCKAKEQADRIFDQSKKFPAEEKYSLTDQIRRSSRSVCACIAEAYRKRHYPAHFVSKLSDADMENAETEVWLDFALSCNYIRREEMKLLKGLNQETGRLIGYMMNNPSKFL